MRYPSAGRSRVAVKTTHRQCVVGEAEVEHDYRPVLIRKAIGDLVRAQRLNPERSLTQEQLAEWADISYEHLNHIENYRVLASVEVLDKIARALGYQSVSEFLALDESKLL